MHRPTSCKAMMRRRRTVALLCRWILCRTHATVYNKVNLPLCVIFNPSQTFVAHTRRVDFAASSSLLAHLYKTCYASCGSLSPLRCCLSLWVSFQVDCKTMLRPDSRSFQLSTPSTGLLLPLRTSTHGSRAGPTSSHGRQAVERGLSHLISNCIMVTDR